MNVPALRGLPGIRIDVAPPPLAEVLPRMDVAVFVGFAATGPTHRPVVIESVAQYAAVFGPDAPLGWDGERGERVYANLGPAVRAFFSNGGRRCWVIRVARTQALEAIWRGSDSAVAPADLATTNRFPLPGVLLAPGNGALLAPTHAQARSTGSWSDSLHVATALGATGIALEGFAVLPPAGATQRITFNTRAPLQTGDLIQFDSPAAGAGSDTVQTYAAIDRVVTVTNGGRSLYRIDATICATFEVLGGRAGSLSVFFAAGTAEVAGVTAGPLPATLQIDPAASMGASLHFAPAVPATLVEGQWARWTDGSQIVWLRIDAVSRRPSPLDATLTDTLVEGAAWRETTPLPLSSPISVPDRASLITLDLRVFRDQAAAFRLAGVGLTPSHRASWWQQISDDVYYAPQNGQLSAPGGASGQVSRDFPLVALDDEFLDPTPRAFIPLGVKPLYGSAPGPLPEAASALERDGLARFDAELFLDPELATTEVGTLVAEADAIRFLRPAPRSLFGLHAALSVGAGGLCNEASLIAVPDALHIGWTQRPDTPPQPATPAPGAPPAHWFTHRGPCAATPKDAAAAAPDFSHFLDCGTRALAAPILSGPTGRVQRGAFRLTWTPSEPGADYALQEAQRADFNDAREIYRGGAHEYDVNATREGISYYRVSAIAGDERSADSNAVAVFVRDDEWLLAMPEDFATQGETNLLRVHRALLRLCAASGELFAALALPQHYRTPEAIRYAARLRAGRHGGGTLEPDGFDFAERSALSYGALYHPWVVSGALPPPRSLATDATGASQGSQPPAAVTRVTAQTAAPPDGTMMGVMAARASARGAWIAPANEPFKDIVALTPPIELAAWLPLQDAQVNLIRADARGFLALSADTLADELERLPINVRRLLILLRRMAVRRGASYVFEPNGDTLRRSVERGFTVLLNDMFRRGAFAGATAAESFKVVTDDTINTATDRDAGRLLVELRVAPSLPLQFLTVRLVQTGERLSIVEEL